ncbi:DUF6274 family protein [Streptomyces sp. NPDC057900]|uniref:DUF6274 family protein n=1 Tax=Streptomyces sp. NPDC057900 TaxID=3346274 RepID=UPI0036E85C82
MAASTDEGFRSDTFRTGATDTAGADTAGAGATATVGAGEPVRRRVAARSAPRHEIRALLRAHLAAATGYRHLTRHCAVCARLLRLAMEPVTASRTAGPAEEPAGPSGPPTGPQEGPERATGAAPGDTPPRPRVDAPSSGAADAPSPGASAPVRDDWSSARRAEDESPPAT